MRRRDFLRGGGLALGASVLPFASADRRSAAAPAPARPLSATSSWEEVRAEFDLDPGLVHMAGFYLASHPRSVREAIERHRRGLEADPISYLDDNVERFEVHQVVAGLRRRGIVASVTPGFYGRSYARLAPGLLTLEADVERTLAAVRAL